MDFWDHLLIVTMMAVRDNLRDNEKQDRINALRKQIVEYRKLPAEEMDFIGELHYFEYLKRMADIAFSLADAANDPDAPDMNEIFPLFLTGMLYDIINMASMNPQEKAATLDKTMRRCSVKLELGGMQYSGSDVYRQMEEQGPIYLLLKSSQMTVVMHKMILFMSVKAEKRNVGKDFASACFCFLVGLERELAKEHPFCGFGSLCGDYMGDILKKMDDPEFIESI